MSKTKKDQSKTESRIVEEKENDDETVEEIQSSKSVRGIGLEEVVGGLPQIFSLLHGYELNNILTLFLFESSTGGNLN